MRKLISAREPEPIGPSARWIRWREQRLIRAGFAPRLARATAREPQVDIHELLELVDRGCPPELAARIGAPLDSEAPRR